MAVVKIMEIIDIVEMTSYISGRNKWELFSRNKDITALFCADGIILDRMK